MSISLIELGELMVSSAQRRLEAIAENVSGTATPGYKRALSFDEALDVRSTHTVQQPSSGDSDLAAGPLRQTGRALDLALIGEGFFALRGESGSYYTRAGAFERASDGRLISPSGLALQDASGGDIIIESNNPEILADGVVLDNGAPTARIGLFRPSEDARLVSVNGALFQGEGAKMIEARQIAVRQGALENSNVELAAEMVDMMAALRRAEAGARVIQTYDALIGQSITTLGRSQR